MFALRLLRVPLICRLQSDRQASPRRSLLRLPRWALAVSLGLVGCGEPLPGPDSTTPTRASELRVLAMGDSMLAWHRGSRLSISDELERHLGTPVIDRSFTAARYNYVLPISGALGLNISKQYRDGEWDWVVVNGGGNDLWFGCGCVACGATLGKLISADAATGKIPDLVSRIRRGGARVVYLGYLHSPGSFSIVDHCKDDAIELENRLAALSSRQEGFYFLRLSNLVPRGDRRFHSVDMIHPSAMASKMIGGMVARIIREESL